MSVTYPNLTKTKFPNQIDTQTEWRDPGITELPLVNQYSSLVAAGQGAAAIELLQANPSLEECIINADKLLQIYHAMIAIERYFFDDVEQKIFRIGNLKGDWNDLMSSDASGDNLLNKYDIVRYPVDGISQYFLVYGDEIQAGEIPTESEKYLQMSMKGDTGEAGYTPIKNIDYFDGTSGLGLSPRGVWVNNLDYFQYDMVSHNGYLWYCLDDNIAKEPSVETVWVKIEISMQSSVGSDIPTALEEGGIWLHMQDDGHIIIKTKNADGEYVTMFPETQASYVKDATGASLQRKIYQHYFDRDDVRVVLQDNDPVYTTQAFLLGTSIKVAEATLTDNSDVDNTMIREFTAYDETGNYVMYRCVDTYTMDEENGTYMRVPEVII